MKTLTAVTVVTIAGAAQGEVLLYLDLTVENQITMFAASGASSATITGSNFTGIYLDDIFAGAGSSLSATLLGGNLTPAQNPTDNSPSLFRGGAGADTGLNVWSMSTDSTIGFTAGEQAFTGSATWEVSSEIYAEMLTGTTFGDIYFPADTSGDISDATLIGQYFAMPGPGTLPLAGLAMGTACVRRRR